MKRLILTLTLALITSTANAGDVMRSQIWETIKNGSYEGIAEDGIAAIYGLTTKSDAPLKIKMTRLRKFKGDCAELKMEFVQEYVRSPDGTPILNKQGKPAGVDVSFKMPICMDGHTPQEAIDEEHARRTKVLSACDVKIVRGKQVGEAFEGKITFRGCPAGGQARITFAGECAAIAMAENQYTAFDFDGEGKAEAGLRFPASCGTKNLSWSIQIVEVRAKLAQEIGLVVKKW